MMDEVVVTATKTKRLLADVPQDMSVITEEQIIKSNAETIGDVLKYTPGLDVSLSDDVPGTATYQATMRGLSIDNGYGLFLIDGRRVKGRAMGEYGNGLNQIPVEMVERIEVVKGPGSVLYGSDAVTGIINIITKPVADTETFGIHTDYGSHNTAREGFTYSKRMGNIGFRTSGTMERTDLDKYDGRFFNNRMNYHAGDNALCTLDVDFSDMESTERNERRVNLSPEVSLDLGNGSELIVKGYWYDWNFLHSSREGDILYNQAETQYTRFLTEKHRITAGGEFLRQALDYTYKGTDPSHWPLVKKNIDTYSFYVQDEWSPTAKTYFVLGTRFDSHSSYGGVVSPRISGLLDVTKSTRLRASVGRSFKSPTIRQLYYPEPFSHGSYEYIISNPDLKPEYGTGYSLSLEHSYGPMLLGNVMVFRNDLDNMVLDYFTGDEYAGKPLKSYENISRAYTQGVECELHFQMMSGLSGSVSLAYTDSENKDTGKKARYLPEHSEGLQVNYLNTRFGFGVNWGMKYVGPMFKDEENTLKTDGYVMAEAKISKIITERTRFSIAIDNLFDSDYGDPATERIKRTITGTFNLTY